MIVMEAQRGESSVAEICRKHAIAQSVLYKWNKEFMEAGKKDWLVIQPGRLPVMRWLICAKKISG